MPPIGIPKDDLPKSGPQVHIIAIFMILMMAFSAVSTVIVMNAFGKKVESAAKAAAIASGCAEAEGREKPIAPQDFIASFELDLGALKKIENNLFTLKREETGLDARQEEGAYLRTYISWDRPEGMDQSMIWAKVSFVKLIEGQEPVVTTVEAVMHATEMFIVDGASLMFDPVSDAEVLFTFDATQFWANQHPGAAKK